MGDVIREIVDDVLSGELEQYRKIVRRFEADVFRAAAPALRDRAAAEDVTQEVFAIAYRKLDSFETSSPDSERAFRVWLFGIAKNVVRNELRQRSRESAKIELYARYVDAIGRGDVSHQSDKVSAALATCRESLTDVAANAIRLRYDQACDLPDVARGIQRSVVATRQLLYRTRLALRDCIETRLADSGDA